MIIAKIGVKLLSIPVYPDDRPVSAKVNKNAGKKFPHSPTMASGNRFFTSLRFLNDFSDQGKRARPAIVIRSAAT